jgi:uncharacterized protein (TIGR02217 family)
MDLFPDLPGLTWSVTKAPKFATRTQTSISGRELRVADQAYPIWIWTLQYSFLRDERDMRFGAALGNGYDELRTLMGFYAKQQGSFNTFLYDDPTDNLIANESIGISDGSSTQYQLIRSLTPTSFSEPITQPANIAGIYANGVAIPYSLGANGVVTVNTAPPAGTNVTATFSYYWPVRFTEDTAEFENFMYQLWALKKLSFQSVLLP